MSIVTEKFEGLNLPQLLDLMHGIVVPDPVSWTPQTQGWWVLLAWFAAVVLLCAARFAQNRRRNRYRREALAELRDIERTAKADPAGSATAVAMLIKRTALAVWPREQVAAKYGKEWAEFLGESASNDRLIVEAAQEIARAAYDPDSVGADLVEPARRWIRLHRV